MIIGLVLAWNVCMYVCMHACMYLFVCVCVLCTLVLSIVIIYKTMMATSCIIKPLCNGFNFFWLQCSEYNGNTMINEEFRETSNNRGISLSKAVSRGTCWNIMNYVYIYVYVISWSYQVHYLLLAYESKVRTVRHKS